MTKINHNQGALLLAACLLPAMASGVDVSPMARQTISRESVSRQQIKAKAERIMLKANDAFINGRYTEAVKLYIQTKQTLQSFKGGDFKRDVDVCSDQIAKSYFYMAQDAVVEAQSMANVKNYEEAIKLCRKAIEYYPENKVPLEKKIREYEKAKTNTELTDSTGDNNLLPDKDTQEYRIEVLMRQGAELAKAKLYDQAARKFREVLLIDPYNTNATYNLNSMNTRNTKIADQRYKLQHRKNITEAEWAYVTPILPEGDQEVVNVIESPLNKKPVSRSGLELKIRNLIIPEAHFEDVSIPTALKKLQELSKVNDPEQKGVNIFLRRNVPTVPAEGEPGAADAARGKMVAGGNLPPPAPPGAEGDEGERVEDAEEGGEEGDGAAGGVGVITEDTGKKVKFIVNNHTLYDALMLLCNTADMKMLVEKHAVIIAPKEVALGEFERKTFPIERSVFDEIDVDDREALKGYFADRSVKFPVGSKIVYNSATSRLTVYNTLENLQMIEEILKEMQENKPAMVEVSAKFVEVSQNDLKELGFDYTISYNPNNAPYASAATGDPIPGTSSNKLSFKDSMSGLNRHASSDSLFVVRGIAGGENGFSYSAAIFAANRADSSDTLAAPRVTTVEGTKAVIKMITERTFVDEYDDGELQQGNSASGDSNSSVQTYTSIGPMPQFDEATPLGITLPIEPVVDKRRRTITLKMEPSVVTFGGYTEFSSRDSSGNETMMRKPILNTRELQTTITIYDGETIVLGGVVDDNVKTINDKIPILGDLPIVGRFFQSRSTVAEKRNLLIFVTCRLVAPDGTPVYASDKLNRGLPNSGRFFD